MELQRRRTPRRCRRARNVRSAETLYDALDPGRATLAPSSTSCAFLVCRFGIRNLLGRSMAGGYCGVTLLSGDIGFKDTTNTVYLSSSWRDKSLVKWVRLLTWLVGLLLLRRLVRSSTSTDSLADLSLLLGRQHLINPTILHTRVPQEHGIFLVRC